MLQLLGAFDAGKTRRRIAQDRAQRVGAGLPSERKRSGEHLVQYDAEAEDVRAVTDAGGEFLAARKIVQSRKSVSSLARGIAKVMPTWFGLRYVNGEPALLLELPATPLRTARRALFRVELDDAGYIREVQLVVATRKLLGVDFSHAPAPSAGPA